MSIQPPNRVWPHYNSTPYLRKAGIDKALYEMILHEHGSIHALTCRNIIAQIENVRVNSIMGPRAAERYGKFTAELHYRVLEYRDFLAAKESADHAEQQARFFKPLKVSDCQELPIETLVSRLNEITERLNELEEEKQNGSE